MVTDCDMSECGTAAGVPVTVTASDSESIARGNAL